MRWYSGALRGRLPCESVRVWNAAIDLRQLQMLRSGDQQDFTARRAFEPRALLDRRTVALRRSSQSEVFIQVHTHRRRQLWR